MLNTVKSMIDRRDTLSLYLRVDPGLEENQADTPAWAIYAKNALRDLERGISPDQEETWTHVKQRAQDYLNNFSAESKGLILFFNPDTEEDQVFELPLLPRENAAHFGEPMVSPLIWLLDEYERYLIVLVDSEQAQFLTTYMGDIDHQDSMESDRFTFDFKQKTTMPRSVRPSDAQATGGSPHDRFEDKMQDHIRNFHKDVAARIREMMKENNVERLILGGSEKSAHDVEHHLHESVKKHLVRIVPIPLNASEKEIMEKIVPVAVNYERSSEFDLVDDVINTAKADGRGALGLDDVQEALKMHQVETLVLAYPPEDDLLLDDLTRKALAMNSQVELVHGAAAAELQHEGGVAARLYYTIPEA